MNLPFSVHLGLKISALKSPNRFIALTGKLAIIGITLGVATLMTVIAVMQGFEEEVRHSLMQDAEHIRVYPLMGKFPTGFQEELSSLPHVKEVVGVKESYALLQSYRKFIPVMLIAYDNDQTTLGKGLDLTQKGIYLSGGVTTYYEPGDSLQLLLPGAKGSFVPKGISVNYLGEMDSISMMPKSMAVAMVPNKIFTTWFGDTEHALSVMVDDLYATTSIKQYIKDHHGGLLQTVDWKDRYHSFFSALRLQRSAMVLILSMITIVAMFSLVSGLVMLSAEKRKQIALLQTMGCSKSRIAMMFFVQGLYICFIGIFLGAMLGFALCHYAQSITQTLESLLGYSLVDKKVYGISHLPVSLSKQLVGSIVAYSMVIGVIASTYPAIKASRIQPAQVLRYG